MAENANGKQAGFYDGVPTDKVQELIANGFDTVALKVRRRNAQGHVASVPGATGSRISTVELLTFEEWLASRYGGGQYEIVVVNPTAGAEPYELIKLRVRVEGTPMPATQNPNAPAFANGQPAPQLPTVPFMQPALAPGMPAGLTPAQIQAQQQWAQGLPPEQRAAFLAQLGIYAPPQPPPLPRNDYGANAALQVTMAQQAQLTGTAAQLQERVNSLQTQMEVERRKAIEDRAADRSKHEAELVALRKELEREHRVELDKLSDKLEREREKRTDLEREASRREMELIRSAKQDSGEDRWMQMFMLMNTNAQAAQQRQVDQQQQSTNQLMAIMNNRQDPNAAIMPLIMKMLDSRSPDAQASLINQMTENQLAQIGAISTLVKQSAGDDPPMWLQIVMQTLGGIERVAASVLRDKRNGGEQESAIMAALTNQQPKGQLPQPAQAQKPPLPESAIFAPIQEQAAPEPAPIVTPAPANGQSGAAAPVPPSLAERVKVEDEVDAMMALPIIPEDWKTPEWRRIIIELHLKNPEVAMMLANLIHHHLTFGIKLPEAISNFQENPRGALESLTEYLPISKSDPEFVNEVIDAVVEAFTRPPEGEDEADPEVVDSAPAQA